MTQAIIERVHHHIRDNIPGARHHDQLRPDFHFRNDLGALDLDMLQLVMDVEDEFEGVVYITDDEAERLQTVGDLEKLVLAKQAQAA
jgi:acyl carrier protein